MLSSPEQTVCKRIGKEVEGQPIITPTTIQLCRQATWSLTVLNQKVAKPFQSLRRKGNNLLSSVKGVGSELSLLPVSKSHSGLG